MLRQRTSWTGGREGSPDNVLSPDEPLDKTYVSRGAIVNAPSHDLFNRDTTWRGTLTGNQGTRASSSTISPKDTPYAATSRFRLADELRSACGCQAYLEAVDTPTYQPCYSSSPARAPSRTWHAPPSDVDPQAVQYFVVSSRSSSAPTVETASPALTPQRGNGFAGSSLVRPKYTLQTDDIKLRTRGANESLGLVGLVDLGTDMPQIVAECKPLISASERLGNGGNGNCPLSPTLAYSTMGKGVGREGREMIGEGGGGTRQCESIN